MTLVALALLCAPTQDAPAPTLQPAVPPILEAADAAPPANGRLARDGFVTGHFTREGETVEYAFEAKKGELSLFDVGNWGLARGWTSTIQLRLLDAEGEVLHEARRSGSTVFRAFQAFVAPADGAYTLELSAPEHAYRFTVVRHSGYRPRAEGEVRPFGEASPVHGYLADPGDRAAYSLELEAGVPVFLRASLTHPQGEKQARNLRARQALRVSLGLSLSEMTRRRAGMDEAAQRAMRRGEGASSSFPGLILEVTDPDGALVAEDRHAALLVPEATGTYRVTVGSNVRGEGGLFDLSIERDPKRVTLSGFVGDRDDDPVAGIRVHLLLEPGFDPIGSTESDAEGEWSFEVPPGPYSVLMQRGDEGPVERLQAGVDQARELNAIWPH